MSRHRYTMTMSNFGPSLFFYLRSSGMCLFVTVYVGLFVIASVILFSPIFRQPPTSPPQPYAVVRDSEFYDSMIPGSDDRYQWEHTLFLNKSKYNTLDTTLTGFRWPVSPTGLINCSSLQDVTDLEFVAAGWTKAVYRAKYRGLNIAIKTVNLNGHDMRECQQRQPNAPLSNCYRRAAAKILKELILLTELAHDNIIKVLGSCVPDAVGPVIIATELGDPLDTVQMLQLSWEHRLQLALAVAKILHHLAHSPLGSLAMNDLRRQQFVLVNGVLKLSDVDDMGITEPICSSQVDCANHILYNATLNQVGLCTHGHCEGHNERLNIWRAGQHFIHHILPLRAPSSLEPQIQLLMEAYSGNSSWNSEQILLATQELLGRYTKGANEPEYVVENYKRFYNIDMLGMFDYYCRDSQSDTSCVHSVRSHIEAQQLCDLDEKCKAVVIPSTVNWTGKPKIVLKTGFSPLSKKNGFDVLLKLS